MTVASSVHTVWNCGSTTIPLPTSAHGGFFQARLLHERAHQAEIAPERRIQLRGEILRTYKDRIQRGEVRLRKDVINEKKNVEVPEGGRANVEIHPRTERETIVVTVAGVPA